VRFAIAPFVAVRLVKNAVVALSKDAKKFVEVAFVATEFVDVRFVTT
jgi:hypothetical protein